MIRRIAKVVLAAPLSVLILVAAGCPTESDHTHIHNVIVIEGSVFASMIVNNTGPNTPINPVAGAVVSTSLSGSTATTDAAGHFRLDTQFDDHQCSTYTVKVIATGHPTYEKLWTGGGSRDDGRQFILSVGWPLEATSTTCSKR